MEFKKRVRKHTALGVEMLSIKSPIPEMYMLSGSFPVGSAHSSQNVLLPEMVAGMLKEGTRSKSKEKIRDILESRGARLSFSASELDTSFTLSALAEDFSLILKLLKELLEEPVFPEKEWEFQRTRLIASMQDVKQDTNEMGYITLLRELYKPQHPHYELLPDEAIALARKTRAQHLMTYHRSAYGKAPMKLAFAGPEDEKIISSILKVFENKKTLSVPLKVNDADTLKASVEKNVEIKDKASVTLFLGQALPIGKFHPDYLALLAGVKALGGDFAARLVQEVREKRGLTYGTYANIFNSSLELSGFFKATASFAPSILAQGEEVMRQVINDWQSKGLGATELEDRKTSMRGSYLVWFSSTRNLLKSLLSTLEDEREVSYLDEYPELVNRLTLAEVNAAIEKYIDPKKLVTVRAGSIPTK